MFTLLPVRASAGPGWAEAHAAVHAPQLCSTLPYARRPQQCSPTARPLCMRLMRRAGSLQGLSLPSPYLDIVSMSQRRAPCEDTRTARLIFDHALMVRPAVRGVPESGWSLGVCLALHPHGPA